MLNPITIDSKVIIDTDGALIHERDLWSSVYLYHSHQDELFASQRYTSRSCIARTSPLSYIDEYSCKVLQILCSTKCTIKEYRECTSLTRIHSSLLTTPNLDLFSNFDRGLGCFHTFHAVVVLIAIISRVQQTDSRPNDIRLLKECVGRFEISGTEFGVSGTRYFDQAL